MTGTWTGKLVGVYIVVSVSVDWRMGGWVDRSGVILNELVDGTTSFAKLN